MKFLQSLATLALLATTTHSIALPQADDQCLAENALCAGFAGPVGTCCSGFTCEYQFPDNAICVPATCLAEGETCVSLLGSLGECCSGTTCTFVASDYSVCKSEC